MKFYKVQTGFGADDYRQIDETELEMCIRAQVTGRVAILKTGSITGSIIQQIIPDWNKVLGYGRTYKLTSEDYTQLGSKVQIEYERSFLEANNRVKGLPQAPSRPALTEGEKQIAETFKLPGN